MAGFDFTKFNEQFLKSKETESNKPLAMPDIQTGTGQYDFSAFNDFYVKSGSKEAATDAVLKAESENIKSQSVKPQNKIQLPVIQSPINSSSWVESKESAAAASALREKQRQEQGYYTSEYGENLKNVLRDAENNLRTTSGLYSDYRYNDALNAYNTAEKKYTEWKDNYEQWDRAYKNRNYYSEQDDTIASLESGAVKKVSVDDVTRDMISGDAKYAIDYIKGTPLSETVGNSPTAQEEIAKVYESYSYMTDAQKNTLLYYASIGDSEKANEYLKAIEPSLKSQRQSKITSNVEKSAEKHPFAGAIAHTAANLTSPLAYVGTAVQAIENKVTGEYKPVDTSSDLFTGTKVAKAAGTGFTKWAVGDDENTTWGNVKAFVAQTGLSLMDMAASTLTGSPNATLALMGLEAAGNTALDLTERGATPDEALFISTAAGAIETLTEKLPIDNLFKLASGGKKTAHTVIKGILSQMGSEATEEMVSEIANNLVDIAVMRNDSEYRQYIQELMGQGYTKEDAEKEAFFQYFVKNTLVSGAGGALSGLVMGTGATAINRFANGRIGKSNGNVNVQNAPQTAGNTALDIVLGANGGNNTAENIEPGIDNLENPKYPKITGNKRALTIAPYYKTLVNNENYAEVKAQSDTVFRQRAQDFSQELGISISQISDNVGGYTFDDGTNVREISYTFYLEDVTDEQADMLAALMSDNGYEVQDTGISSKYITATEATNNPNAALEVAIPIIDIGDDIETLPDLLRDIGVNDFTIDKSQNVIRLYDDPSLGLDKTQIKYSNIIKGIGEYYDANRQTEFLHSQSRFLSASDRADIYRSWIQSETLQRGEGGTALRENIKYASERAESYGQENRLIPPIQQNAPSDGLGAANAGFADSEYNRWVENAQEFHRPGENAVRNPSLPKTNLEGLSTMKTGQTIMESQNTPDARVEQIQDMYVNGELAYVPTTNQSRMEDSRARLERDGWDEFKRNWERDVHSGKSSAQLMSDGALLLNNAANSNMVASEYADLVTDYAMLNHNAGETLEAARILKSLTPEGKLYGIQKSINSLNEEVKGKYNVEISDELLDKYRAATDDAARDAVVDEMAKYVAKQIPSTFLDRFTALRYVNMLGNFRTQIRNISGNATTGLTYKLKNMLMSGLEQMVHLVNKNYQVSRAAFVSANFYKAAQLDFENVMDLTLNGGKYSDLSDYSPAHDFENAVQDNRTIFNVENSLIGNAIDAGTNKLGQDSIISKALNGAKSAVGLGYKTMEAYRKATNKAMEKGDVIFNKATYADQLAAALKARGYTADDLRLTLGASTESTNAKIIPDSVMDECRAQAILESQEATFHDNNELSTWASKVGRSSNTPKAIRAILEGTVPFRKTPANVAVRAEEFSPLGLVNTVVKAVQAANPESDITGTDVINQLSKTLTGSGIMLLGYLLAKSGHLRGKSDDEDLESYYQDNGAQSYALYLPDGTNITLDWVAPASIELFTGAQIFELAAEDGLNFSDIESALTGIVDPMLEMSMLQGINDSIDNISNSDYKLLQLAMNAGIGYLTQGLTNTLAGQLERSFEDNRQTTFADRNSDVPVWLQKTLGKNSAKIPGWDYNQQDYINNEGQKQPSENKLLSLLENVFSPGYISKYAPSDVQEELLRLYKDTGKNNFVPYTSQSQKVDNEHYLTGKEYQQYATTRGQEIVNLMEEVMSQPNYGKWDDSVTNDILSKAKTYGTALAKDEYMKEHDLEYNPNNSSTSRFIKALEAYGETGVTMDVYWKYCDAYNGFVNSDENPKKQQAINYINALDITPKQKDCLYTIKYAESGLDNTPWHKRGGVK